MAGKQAVIANRPLAQIIADHIGENVFLCYQCVKCTSGCPLAEHMDLNPNQVLRAVQLGDDSVLESKTIWVCASCQTCTTRCPQGIDIAAIMDELRIEARARGIKPAIPEVDRFGRLFLTDVRLMGRLHEVGLMAGLNVVNGNLFKDMDLAWEMLKRNKLHLVSLPTRPPRPGKVAPVAPAPNKIAFYPGCSLHSSAAEYRKTIEATAEALDLELVEPPGWICCGSSPAHSTDHVLATLYPTINLSIIEQMGLEEVTTPCAACYIRFKTAAHEMAHNPEIARQVNEEIGYEYQGKVRVMHLVEALIEKVGLDKIEAAVKKPLAGLKVACYYGCYITRPAEITGAEHICQARAATPEAGAKFRALFDAYQTEVIEAYKTSDLSDSQPTKGNIIGGLTTIEEKALGNLEKIGRTSRYIDALKPAESPAKGPGLYYMDTSSAAAECVPLMAAAGYVVHTFPTGQGNVIGNPIVPVIKLSGNPRTVRTMSEHIDLDVSGVLRREMTIDEAGDALIAMIVRTANGRVTAAEALGHREFSLTKLYRSA